MKSNFHRLTVPSFDLTLLSSSSSKDSSKFISNYLLIPGGGGSVRSGVKNQIQIAQLSKQCDILFQDSFKTDSESASYLCSGISNGTINVFNEYYIFIITLGIPSCLCITR